MKLNEVCKVKWTEVRYTIDLQHCGKITGNCFYYIHGFSRRQYIDFTMRRDFLSLIQTPSEINPLRPLRPNHASHEWLGDAGGLAASYTRNTGDIIQWIRSG